MQLETERRSLQEANDALTAAERRLVGLQTELADLQSQLAAVYSRPSLYNTTLHERRDLLSRQFFHSVLNKSSCLNYLLPDERSDAIADKQRHPSIFKLPHVHTTRFKTSFVNYAIDHCL